MIPLRKRLEYAQGYLALNLRAAARAELASLPSAERRRPEVAALELEIAMAAESWTRVVTLASRLARARPADERPWIAWAYALREKQRVAEARDILLRGEAAIPEPSPLVDYNLACYCCLLGDFPEARRRLKRACAREPDWKTGAAADPDLSALNLQK